MTAVLPGHAAVVVVGGGVIGASVAYHLAKGGCSDVLLLERAKISSGTTWHSAGNMEAFREDPVLGEMIRYGIGLFPALEVESGQVLGWRQNGRVMFTTSPERMRHYRTLPALGRYRDIEMHLMTPAEVGEKLPVITTRGVEGGVWIPSDGRINPTDLATAYCRAARKRGARVVEDLAVERLLTENGRITGVVTAQGPLRCDQVVLAAGLWTRDLAATIGLKLPIQAVQHLYILTKPIAEVTRDLPLFFCFEERFYGREDVGGLLLGFFDENAIPISPAELPKDFSFGLLDSNWAQVEDNMAVALKRFPVLEKAEIRLLLNGPESFTPDMNMLIGEAPGVAGCFVAAGMNSSGIGLSPGVGRVVAEWMLEGAPSLDVAHLDVRRFSAAQAGERYIRQRTSEVVTHMCLAAAPGLDFKGGRLMRRSPLHDWLAAQGARFNSIALWEVPLWFASDGNPDDWARHVEAEVEAAETCVVLIDRSSDCKLRLDGPGAEGFLLRLTLDVTGVPVGGFLLARMLNGRGCVETVPTAVRLAEESWLLMVDAAQGAFLAAWLRRNGAEEEATLTDVTSSWAAMLLAGPRAAPLLGLGEIVPGEIIEIELDYASALALPQPELDGVLVLVPSEFGAGALEHLLEAGKPVGLRPAGLLAAHAVMAKAGLLRFGSEITPFRSAATLGLGTPASDRRKLARYAVEARGVYSFAGLPVVKEGRRVGHATSGAYVPSLGRSLVFALLDDRDTEPTHIFLDGKELPLQPISQNLVS